MATYAIGDIQGCFDALERLLRRIAFSAKRDRLWLVGDLVNRGPDSLAVLRFCRKHDASITAVLGNHDLHLLGVAAGIRALRGGDTLDELLGAPDRKRLLRWLRRRPLIHHEGPHLLVHAGLDPRWTPKQALKRARVAQDLLRGSERRLFLETLFRPQEIFEAELVLSDAATDMGAPAKTVGIMTRVRALNADGSPAPDFKGRLDAMPQGLTPWFRAPQRRSMDKTIVFGHWAALGLHLGDGVIGLDTGCVWGRSLTAIRLEDRAIFSVDA